MGDSFFGDKTALLEKLRYCIQQISFTNLTLKGQSAQGSLTTGFGVSDISNAYGQITSPGNAFLFPATGTFSMMVLNTMSPVIENFIYPWIMEVLKTTKKASETLFPKLNLAVKFWSPERVQHDMNGIKPDYVYYITGIFPTTIELVNPSHSASSTKGNRSITFSFADFIILNSKSEAEKYSLGELFRNLNSHTMHHKLINISHKECFINGTDRQT